MTFKLKANSDLCSDLLSLPTQTSQTPSRTFITTIATTHFPHFPSTRDVSRAIVMYDTLTIEFGMVYIDLENTGITFQDDFG